MSVLEAVVAEESLLQRTLSLNAAASDEEAVSSDNQAVNVETNTSVREGVSSIDQLVETTEQATDLTIGYEIYRNSRRMSLRSAYTGYTTNTTSSGQLSQYGATWNEAMERTMNSGFGNGAPRNRDRLMVREGRERGPWLPQLKGVGRTGKGPAPVPLSMLRALGVEEKYKVETGTMEIAGEKAMLPDLDEMLELSYDEVVDAFELDAVDTCLDAINEDLRMQQSLKRLDVLTADRAENLMIAVELRRDSLERKRVFDLDRAWVVGRERNESLYSNLEENPSLKEDILPETYETFAPVTLFELDSVDTCLVEVGRALREQQHQKGVSLIHPAISRPLLSELKEDIEERRLSLVAARPITVAEEWEQWNQDEQAQTLARLATSLLNLYSEVGLALPGNDEDILMDLYEWLEVEDTQKKP